MHLRHGERAMVSHSHAYKIHNTAHTHLGDAQKSVCATEKKAQWMNTHAKHTHTQKYAGARTKHTHSETHKHTQTYLSNAQKGVSATESAQWLVSQTTADAIPACVFVHSCLMSTKRHTLPYFVEQAAPSNHRNGAHQHIRTHIHTHTTHELNKH